MRLMRKNWKKEVMFDIRALGSEFFFFLVFIRSLIGPYFPFVYQLIISGLVIFIFSLVIKNFDGYVARGMVLAVFVSMYYNSQLFYLFATLIFVSSILISKKIVKNKRKL